MHVGIAIIGAGPYGLSLAAHLRRKGIDFMIFGIPMGTWQNHMPSGMHLKSEGFASNLYDPERKFTLKEFCRLNGHAYADIGMPVSLDIFASYGAAFQQRLVPELKQSLVSEVIQDGKEFRLTLRDGEQVWARHVVVAAGISYFGALPDILSDLPSEFVSHSSRHHRLTQFKGRDVVVIGAGSSAVDVALSLHDAGARPQLIARSKDIHFQGKTPERRSLLTRIKNPWSGLGPGWRSRLACDLPLLFHMMPRGFRIKVTKKHLGPAPAWFTRDRVLEHVPMKAGLKLSGAAVREQKVQLQFLDRDGGTHEITADHVIAGTGYRVDLRRLGFLNEAIFNRIATEEDSPVLSSKFESTVPGLYFVGTCAAFSFGPLLRFAFGAGFASNRLSRHLARRVRKGLKNEERGRSTSFDSGSPAVTLD
jgi:thioredoxin reductase